MQWGGLPTDSRPRGERPKGRPSFCHATRCAGAELDSPAWVGTSADPRRKAACKRFPVGSARPMPLVLPHEVNKITRSSICRFGKGNGVTDGAGLSSTDETADPRGVYVRRLDDRRRRAALEEKRQRWTGNARVALVIIALALVYPIFFTAQLAAGWLLFAAALFVAISIVHDRVTRAWSCAVRAVEFYERGLARLENRWAGLGRTSTRFLDNSHPYALDLDLFGSGSLFELLCTVRTTAGEQALAGWLLQPADAEEVKARQSAIAELRPRVDLREESALLGADVPEGIDLDGLAAWGAAPPALVAPRLRIFGLILAFLAVVTLLGWAFLNLGASPFLSVIFLEALLALRLRRGVRRVLDPVERRGHDLLMLAGLLSRLEHESFRAPLLRQLRDSLVIAGQPPSWRLARLARLLDWLDSRRNPFFAPVAALLLWSTQLAFRIEAWRLATGPAIRRWLKVVGEFEALCALATYAYENPSDSFPELVAEGPCYVAEGIGHLLIARPACVINDVNLGPDVRLLIVSGSNMSGKSTLLRTVGVNAVLALAGAPVRARRLRLSSLAIGATLRIQDSLREGRSRFYAELLRIRQLMELARGPRSLLFLLDELFQGTNSHDRRLGAEAVLRGLVETGAIGVITTHDLALTSIAEHLAPHAANVHFEDHFENGAMTFDYRMRPGVVQKSNAL